MLRVPSPLLSFRPTLVSLLLCVVCVVLSVSPVLAQDGSMLASGKRRSAPADLPAEEALVVKLYNESLTSVVSVFGETERLDGDVLETTRSHGSGVLVDSSRILTVSHVVKDKHRILVRTQDGVERSARLVRVDEIADLALLELETPLHRSVAAEFGDSDRLAVGQRVIAIGNPFGLENSLSVGRVSGFREGATHSGGVRPEYIQTDAAINSGNSGGPLFDSSGRVIGIASKFWSVSGGSEGVGFAVAINTAKSLFELGPRRVAAMSVASP